MPLPSGPIRRPSPGEVVRHAVDAAAAPIAFVVVNAQAGPRWAALVALVVALAVGGLRRHRGEPLVVVAVSTTIVALHSASALAVGEGRAFFLPELVINAAGLVVCGLSLLLGRPVTAFVGRKIGLAPGTPRLHRRLTAAWTALWVVHLLLLVPLYLADSVVGLTVTATFVNKPTMLATAVATAVAVRRSPAPVVPDPALEGSQL
jgi:hypothetical protein